MDKSRLNTINPNLDSLQKNKGDLINIDYQDWAK
jgi:hypothetical protein